MGISRWANWEEQCGKHASSLVIISGLLLKCVRRIERVSMSVFIVANPVLVLKFSRFQSQSCQMYRLQPDPWVRSRSITCSILFLGDQIPHFSSSSGEQVRLSNKRRYIISADQSTSSWTLATPSSSSSSTASCQRKPICRSRWMRRGMRSRLRGRRSLECTGRGKICRRTWSARGRSLKKQRKCSRKRCWTVILISQKVLINTRE